MKMNRLYVIGLAATVAIGVAVVFLCAGCTDVGIQDGGGEAKAFLSAYRYGGGGSNGGGGGDGGYTDIRDGHVYRTVKIGEQTWMANNMAYETSSSVVLNDFYGRLYTWTDAKSVCPDGWKLPTRDEWGQLFTFVGGTGDYGADYDEKVVKRLKATSGWLSDNGTSENGTSENGTDDFGFSARPGGRTDGSGTWSYPGRCGYWWTSTTVMDDGSEYAVYRQIITFGGQVSTEDKSYVGTTDVALSVRCLQDAD